MKTAFLKRNLRFRKIKRISLGRISIWIKINLKLVMIKIRRLIKILKCSLINYIYLLMIIRSRKVRTIFCIGLRGLLII